jgi:hypothetical protein
MVAEGITPIRLIIHTMKHTDGVFNRATADWYTMVPILRVVV